jgi:hypothetical protein
MAASPINIIIGKIERGLLAIEVPALSSTQPGHDREPSQQHHPPDAQAGGQEHRLRREHAAETGHPVEGKH